MAIRGRKPDPAAADATMTAAVALDGDLVPPPDVAAWPEALALWEHVLATTRPGWLKPVDGPLLANYCRHQAWADTAAAAGHGAGLLVEGATGPVPNPCLGLFTRHSESARKLASELRITPAERARRAA